MGKSTAEREPKLTNADDIGPTLEQLNHGRHERAIGERPFEIATVKTHQGMVVGRAYRRQPWFESLAKREQGEARKEKRSPWLGLNELLALRQYRSLYEACNRSEVRCALDMRVRGGVTVGEPSLALQRAKDGLRMAEALLGPFLATMRAVALLDQTYADVAMKRWGSREVDVISAGVSMFRQVPRSAKHQMKVRDEFMAGVERLTVGLGYRTNAVRVAKDPVEPKRLAPQIAEALAEAREGDVLWAAQAVIDTLKREAGVEEMDDVNGVPIVVKDGWNWGWLVAKV